MFTISWVDGAIPDGDHYKFTPCLQVKVATRVHSTVWVSITKEASLIYQRRLGGDDPEAHLDEALIRYGVMRLERHLSADPDSLVSCPVWILNVDDVDELLNLDIKQCDYAVRDGRDLFCTAAGNQDEAVVGSIGRRSIAPTSVPICERCDLPDSTIVCTHLMHPQVEALRAMGGFHDRNVRDALCDRGHDEIGETGKCRAAGHKCWQRKVDIVSETVNADSSMTILEAFDFLDAAWRLQFGKSVGLLHVTRLSEPVGLLSTCSDRDGFRARMSDLADVLDRLNVDDGLMPATAAGDDMKGSMNRMQAVLEEALPAENASSCIDAIRVLRKVRRLRVATQHSGAAEEFSSALGDLNLTSVVGDWSLLWISVRAVATAAISTIRIELQRSQI